jgi:cellulose synthase operon protein C
MTKKPGEFEFDEDWDAALEDWETNAFTNALSNVPPPVNETDLAEEMPTVEADVLSALEDSSLSRPTVHNPVATNRLTEHARGPRSLDPEFEDIDTILEGNDGDAPSSRVALGFFDSESTVSQRGRQDSVTRVLLGTTPPSRSGPPPLEAGGVEPLELSLHERLEDDERSSTLWLTAEERQDFWDTGRWLAEEANVAASQVESAHLYLAASEIASLAGDRAAAVELTEEAVRAAPDDEACALLYRQHALLTDGGEEALARERTLASTDARKRTLAWLSAAYLRYRGSPRALLVEESTHSLPMDLEGFIESWKAGMEITEGVAHSSPVFKAAVVLRALVFDNWNAEDAPSLPFREAAEAMRGERIPETVTALCALAAAEPELRDAATWIAASSSLHHDGTRVSTGEHLARLNSPLANRALATFGAETKSTPLLAMAADSLSEDDAPWVLALFPTEETARFAAKDFSPPAATALASALNLEQALGEERAFARAATSGNLAAHDTRFVRDAESAEISAYFELREGRRVALLDALDHLLLEGSVPYVVAAALSSERLGESERARKYYGIARSGDAWGALNYGSGAQVTDEGELLVSLLEAIRTRDGEQVHERATALAAQAPTWRIAELLGELGTQDPQLAHWRRAVRDNATDDLELGIFQVRSALFHAAGDEPPVDLLRDAVRLLPRDLSIYDSLSYMASSPPDVMLDAPRDSAGLQVEGALQAWQSGLIAPALLQFRQATLERESPLAYARAALEVEAGDEQAAARLLEEVRATEDAQKRVEGYELLAELDRANPSSVLLWHRSILEELPSHLPSLRTLEHALISEGRESELEPLFAEIAHTLSQKDPTEVTAHAHVAARLRTRGDDAYWPQTKAYAELAAGENPPSLWALRALNAHARHAKSDVISGQTYNALVPLASAPADKGALLLRAAESYRKQARKSDALAALEEAARLDSEDLLAWEALAEAYELVGKLPEAARACESMAEACSVEEHQLSALYEAAQLWRKLGNTDNETTVLERAAARNPAYSDVFGRLSQLYTVSGRKGDLAQLLESRLSKAETLRDRTALQVDLGRALFEMGDHAGAARALQSALHSEPGHLHALHLYASAMYALREYGAAEASWVQLARFATTPKEQRAVYLQLGDLYATHLGNPGRAEIAYQEILKRTPDDEDVMRKLVGLYRDAGDAGRTLDAYEAYLRLAQDPKERERRLVELSHLTETIGQNPKKAEGILEASRKEFPTSVVSLRALAEFFGRQKHMPAMNVLLDRAAADARRAIAAGRFTASLFQTLSVVFELRGRAGGAAVVDAALAAFEGRNYALEGLGARAVDPRLDEFTAPELISPPFRTLLSRNGDALDTASPLDIKRLSAGAVPPQFGRVTQVMGQLAQQMGMGGLTVLASPRLGRVCLPAASSSPTVVVGIPFLEAAEEGPRLFLTLRALKLVYMRASLLVRMPPGELAVMLGAWFKAFNPNWVAPGLNAVQLAEASKKVAPAMPKKLDPQLGMMALEAASTLGNLSGGIGSSVVYWSNRTALLGTGDVASALTALAWSLGQEDLPSGQEARAAWISRTPDARDLLTYSVSDPYLEARRRSGLSA